MRKRIVTIDALRGIALAGIIFVHMAEMFLAHPPIGEIKAVLLQSQVDLWLNQALYWVVRGKFFLIFSFLFGLSFSIQYDLKAGAKVGGTAHMIFRLCILACIGLLHRLFYAGDILVIYASLGLALLPLTRLTNRALLIISVLLILGAGRLTIFLLWGTTPLFPNPPNTFGPNYLAILQEGSFHEVAQVQWARLAGAANFQLLPFLGRAYLTLACFLLGVIAGRIGLFEKDSRPLLRNILFSAFMLLIPLLWAYNLVFEGFGHIFGRDYKSITSMLKLSLFDIVNVTIATVIVAMLLICLQSKGGKRFALLIAPFGRMALSNYLLQSILGTAIFFGWGMGFAGKVSLRVCLLLACSILTLQLMLSFFWLKFFQHGPVEYLWRRLTRVLVEVCTSISAAGAN